MRPGDTLGPYRVLGKLGEGGMGEVYRARDTKLDRDVAIKILPELFAADDERVARFEREAKTLASLNHPLIAQIFGLEDSNGVRALVMELVEGPTLAEVIAGLRPQAPDLSSGESRGPKSEARGLPVREALGIARQIAEALEAAHELGIIHRDLTPANVKVRDDGTVNVLDFGLAKAIGPAEAGHYRDGGADVRSVRLQPDLSNAPTITSPAAMTRQGIILGTAAYMPPEQARGRAVDKRADIWAFGAVLFEMLTGKRAFPGEDVSDTLAAVLLAEPDWAAMPAETPPRVGALLRRCLQKDPRERQRDIGDVRLEISEVLGGAPEPQSTLAPSSPRVRSRERLAWIVAAVFCLSTIGVAALGYLARTPADALVQRFSILPPANTALGIASGSLASPVLSPDGRYLAFPLTSAGRPLLWVRPIDSLSPQALQGTDGARYPFWSPDSSAIAFFTTGKLKKIQVSGGPPQTICDAPAGFGGTWNRDGEIVFSPSEFSVLFRVSANGGTATPATTFDRARGEEGHRFPSFLPDGRHFVYLALAGATGSARGLGIDIGALDSAAGRRLLDADTPAVYAGPGRSAQRTGYLLFVRDETLLAQPFDAARLETAGEAVPLATGMAQSTAGGFSASANGVLAYRTGGLERQLVWLDRNGTRLGTLGPVGRYGHVEIAPDGGRVAVDRIDPQSRGWDIWLFDAASGIPARFTFSQPSRNARWSSDGRFILFQKTAEAIFRKPSDGTGNEEVLYEASTGGGMVPSDSSPDGRWFVYRQVSRGTPGSLWVLPLSGERQPKMVAQTEVRGTNGRFSPDGRWMAYASEESGRVEVCVQPYPGSGAKWQVSREGGTFPRWRGDGKELFYVTNGKVMGVPVEGGSSFRAGTAMPLVEVPFGPDVVQAYPYAVTRDGQRFLVIAPVEEAGSSAFTVVLNWTVALQRPQPGTR